MSSFSGRVWRDDRTGSVWRVAVIPRADLPLVAFGSPEGCWYRHVEIEGSEWGLTDQELAAQLDRARGPHRPEE